MPPVLTIKFSHPYSKLKDVNGKLVEKARLLEVLRVNPLDLHKVFLDYDTDMSRYVLPMDAGIMNLLIFQDPLGHVFTTIRPLSSNLYYNDNVGKAFMVLIKGRDYR